MKLPPFFLSLITILVASIIGSYPFMKPFCGGPSPGGCYPAIWFPAPSGGEWILFGIGLVPLYVVLFLAVGLIIVVENNARSKASMRFLKLGPYPFTTVVGLVSLVMGLYPFMTPICEELGNCYPALHVGTPSGEFIISNTGLLALYLPLVTVPTLIFVAERYLKTKSTRR